MLVARGAASYCPCGRLRLGPTGIRGAVTTTSWASEVVAPGCGDAYNIAPAAGPYAATMARRLAPGFRTQTTHVT
jgi:hypothetical protein